MRLYGTRRPSRVRSGARWLLLTLAFVWLVGCASPTKKLRDPFAQSHASEKFSCGEEVPRGTHTNPAALRQTN